MQKPQVSSNIGVISIAHGFLRIFGETRFFDFMSVFTNLTYGQIFEMLLPFLIGIVALWHNEETSNKKY